MWTAYLIVGSETIAKDIDKCIQQQFKNFTLKAL